MATALTDKHGQTNPAPAMRLIGALAAGLIAAAAWPVPAAADQGVSLSLGSIAVSVPLQPGREYRLPQLFVFNPGDETSSYVMDAVPIGNEAGPSIQPAWLAFEPLSFTLEPGARREVVVVLRLPQGVEPGQYHGMIRAVLRSQTSGAVLGAAAGSRLTFTIDSGAASLLHGLIEAWNAGGSWSWLLAALLAGAALAVGFRRRFNLRIERRE